jgi:hypothetical protein
MTAQSGQSRGVFRRLFPAQIDNVFRGHRLALWLFAPYALVKLIQGTLAVFNPASTAVNADGIPLNGSGAAAAELMTAMFAVLGLNLLVLPLLGVLALIRYRAMIPLVYLMMLTLNLSSRALQLVHPIARIGGVQPISFYVNLFLLGMLVVGFGLSLTDRSR